MRFTAVHTFWSDETMSEYVEGLSYRADEEPLLSLVQQWLENGLIRQGGGEATMTGTGE